MKQQGWSRRACARWTIVTLTALIAAGFPVAYGSADTTGYTLTRFVDNVNTICVAPRVFGGMQTRYKRRRTRDWSVPTVALDEADFLLVGSNITTNAGTCVSKVDIQLYTAGTFTPLAALPGAIATTGWEVTLWQGSAGVAAPVDVEVVNDTPRPFSVRGVSPLISLAAASPSALTASSDSNTTTAPSWSGLLSRSDISMTWPTLPIVEAYFLQHATATSMYNTAWGESPQATILVSESVSTSGRVKWVATYLYFYQAPSTRTLKFEVFEASFYQPAPVPVSGSLSRKLLTYPPPPPPDESSYIDSASLGVCPGGYCYPRSPVPSWCVRGAAAYPRCLYVCICP
eukprot:jgi/Mesen1/1984/ME000147S01080